MKETQDEFAMKFAYWCDWYDDRGLKTHKELLAIYKKEKNEQSK